MYLLLATAWAALSVAAQEQLQPFVLQPPGMTLVATWEKLADSKYNFAEQFALIRDLKPAEESRDWEATAFQPFLPTKPVAVGDTWPVRVDDVIPLLKQFHTGATDALHHDGGTGIGAHGGWACLAHLDQAHAEIRFRLHAEFLIAGDGKPLTSSWFTPAQFRGRIIVDLQRNSATVFELAVPDQTANVDINIAHEDTVVADIGRIPRMELRGGSSAKLATGPGHLSEAETDKLLAEKFYPFAEIGWLGLAEAVQRSRETGKPLHVIALFGSLFDESC
jgi:hypothetical protein